MKKTILFFTLITLVAFSSCDKDGYDKKDFDKEKWEEKEDWEKEECFKLVYPITFIMPDASSITVNDDKDSAMKDWYDNNDSEEKPQLQYPVDIIYEDDGITETITISNEDEMIDAKKECYDDKWEKEECFVLVFPLTFTMPDNSVITGNNEAELWSAMESWYEANPDSEEKAQLQYPVDIIFKDDTTQTINNEDEMETAKEECED